MGIHAAALQKVRQELANVTAARERLAQTDARLAAQLAESEALLRRLSRNGWVKLGAAAGLVRLKPKAQKTVGHQTAAAQAEANSAPAPLSNLR